MSAIRILFFIVLLALALRFYQLVNNPPGLNGDEAAIGYNAFSILKTGRDEYGQKFPLTFRSFDDYKPPLYIYLTVPSVALFGLNELGIRFPSAFLGVWAVVLTYFLTKRLVGSEKMALMAAFLLAVSPWHLQFTRTAYETGSLAFFTSLGLFLFFKPGKSLYWAVLAGLVFGLELFLYQAARVFVPLFVAFLLWQNKAKLLATGAVVAIFCLVTGLVLLSPATRLRLAGTSIFQDNQIRETVTSFRITDWSQNNNKLVLLFHPAFFDYGPKIIGNYLTHFRPDFLVSNTASPIDFFVPSLSTPKIAYVPTVGLLLLWELPFLVLGLYFLAKNNKKLFAFCLVWLLLVPLPAALTLGVPSSVRTAAFLPVIQIIIAVGFVSALQNLSKLRWILLLVIVYQLAYFFHILFVHSPVVYANVRYPIYKQMVIKTVEMAKDYQSVVVSTRLDVPYIFFLTYLKYDPARYQTVDGGTVSGGFAEDRNHFDKYSFRRIDWLALHNLPKTLFVGLRDDFPTEAHLVGSLNDTIYFARSDQ